MFHSFLTGSRIVRTQITGVALGAAAVAPAIAERPDILWARAGHSEMVLSAELSSDSSRVVSSAYDGTVKVWDASSGQFIFSVRAFGATALAPNDDRIATQTGLGVQVRRLSDGALLQTVGGTTFARPAWSPDGQFIAASDAGNTIRVSDATSGATVRVLSGHTALIRSATYSPSGAFLVSTAGLQGADNTARIWSTTTWQQLRLLSGHTDYVAIGAVSPDSTIVATGGGDRTVKLWNASSGALIRTLTGATSAIWDLTFSPDGQRVYAASISGPIRIWNVADGVEQPGINVPGAVRSIRFSRDGQTLVVGTQLSQTELRSSADGSLLARFGLQRHELARVRISDDGRTLVYGHDDLRTTRVRARDGAPLDEQALSGLRNQNGIVFSPDASTAALLTGSNNITQLWDLDTGQAGVTMNGHVSVIYASAFSPDGTRFATAGEYQSGMWNVATGSFVHWFQDDITHSHAAVAFSSDGSKVAVTDRGNAKVFDSNTATLLHSFSTGVFELTVVGLTPDGTKLIAGGDGQLRAWNLSNNSAAWSLTTNMGRNSDLCFSRNSRYLFASGQNGVLQIRRVSDGSLLHSYDEEMGTTVTALSLSPTQRTFAYTRTDATLLVARNPVWTVGDIDGDGVVALADLALLLTDFGRTDEPAFSDLNDDGATDLADLALLLSNFGAAGP